MAKKPAPDPAPTNLYQTGLVILKNYGVQGALVLGLAYWATVIQGGKVDTLASEVKALTTAIGAHQATTTEIVTHLQQDTQQGWQLVALTQRVCLNTAKTDSDRLNCVVAK